MAVVWCKMNMRNKGSFYTNQRLRCKLGTRSSSNSNELQASVPIANPLIEVDCPCVP